MLTDSRNATPFRLLVVEDDPGVLDLLEQGLTFAGFEVFTARSGSVALQDAADQAPDLVVLDVVLPDVDGFSVCRQLRADGDQVPVIFLTARDTDDDVLSGFEFGGDDYMRKPFRLKELVARIQAVLKRVGPDAAPGSHLGIDDLQMDVERHVVQRCGTPIDLSPTEFRMLRFFMLNPEVVLSKPEILDHVWGRDHQGNTTRVETYVSYLRHKLGSPQLIQTIWGVGYALRATPDRAK